MRSLIVLFFLTSSHADSLNSTDQKATTQTQDLLRDPKARKEAIKKDKDAQKADHQVNDLTNGNSELNQDIYELAAEVFPDLAKQANGDPKKMQEILQKAAQNPDSFAGKWTPEQQKRLHEISEKLNRTPSHISK